MSEHSQSLKIHYSASEPGHALAVAVVSGLIYRKHVPCVSILCPLHGPLSNRREGYGMLSPAPEVEMLGVSTAQATAVSAVAASDSIATLPRDLSLPLLE